MVTLVPWLPPHVLADHCHMCYLYMIPLVTKPSAEAMKMLVPRSRTLLDCQHCKQNATKQNPCFLYKPTSLRCFALATEAYNRKLHFHGYTMEELR